MPAPDSGDRRCQPAAGETVSDCVLAELEDVKGREFVEEEFILYDHIDPDALNNLFQGDAGTDISIEFCINGVSCITVHGDHDIIIHVDDLDTAVTNT